MELRNRRRLQALLIVAVFAVPVLVMLGLALGGWVPHGRSYGQRIQPERELAAMPVRLADGQSYAWRNQNATWTLVALPGKACAEHCLRQLDLMHRAKLALGRQTDKLHLLYLGAAPMGAAAVGFDTVWQPAQTTSSKLDDLRARAPDTVSAVLVTPDGQALTLYPVGFDAEGLRQDLKKAVH